MVQSEIVEIDVRDLPAPGPLQAALEAVESLKENQRLVMLHRRSPCKLFDFLKERGLTWREEQLEEELFRVEIYRPDEEG